MAELVPAYPSDHALDSSTFALIVPEREGGGGWSHEVCLAGICHDCAS